MVSSDTVPAESSAHRTRQHPANNSGVLLTLNLTFVTEICVKKKSRQNIDPMVSAEHPPVITVKLVYPDAVRWQHVLESGALIYIYIDQWSGARETSNYFHGLRSVGDASPTFRPGGQHRKCPPPHVFS